SSGNRTNAGRSPGHRECRLTDYGPRSSLSRTHRADERSLSGRFLRGLTKQSEREERTMPHVTVKLWPGKSEQQKTPRAEAITKDVMAILHYGEESVSIAMEEVQSQDWAEKVYKPDIQNKWDRLNKKPGYDVNDLLNSSRIGGVQTVDRMGKHIPLIGATNMNREPSAAQQAMGDLAPKFAELTDNVLFGDIWERKELSKRDRS